MAAPSQASERAEALSASMGEWAQHHELAGLLRNLYANVVVARPADPLTFLVHSLSKRDARGEDEQEAALKEAFALVAAERANAPGMSAAEAVVNVRAGAEIVRLFPLHAAGIGELLAATPEDLDAFRGAALAALAQPAV